MILDGQIILTLGRKIYRIYASLNNSEWNRDDDINPSEVSKFSSYIPFDLWVPMLGFGAPLNSPNPEHSIKKKSSQKSLKLKRKTEGFRVSRIFFHGLHDLSVKGWLHVHLIFLLLIYFRMWYPSSFSTLQLYVNWIRKI